MGMTLFVVDSPLRASEFTHNERPFPVRWRRADLRGRVNGNLQLRFEHKGLSSYGGLEFVRRFFSIGCCIGNSGVLATTLLRCSGDDPRRPGSADQRWPTAAPLALFRW